MRWMFVLFALLAVPGRVWAGLLPDGGVTAPEVAAALKSAGYPADILADRSGDPIVRSSTGKVLFHVNFYQCGIQLRCGSIQFIAPLRYKSTATAAIAAWNRDHRFGRAFLDTNGLAKVAMDVETSHGFTTEALAAYIERWVLVVAASEQIAGR